MKVFCCSALLCIGVSIAFAENAPVGVSYRENGKVIVIDGDNYRALLLGNARLFSLDMRSGDHCVPVISKAAFMLRGHWERILDQGNIALKAAPLITDQDGSISAALSAENARAKLRGKMTFRADRIEFNYTVEFLDDVAKCGRIALEMEPLWQGFSGSRILLRDSKSKDQTAQAPLTGTADRSYATILSEKGESLEVTGIFGGSGGLTIEGPRLLFGLEYSGERFVWQAGAPIDVTTAFKKGDVVNFSFAVRVQVPARITEPNSPLAVNIDVGGKGPKISPYLFGSQIGSVGIGEKLWSMRNEWADNPRHDPEFAAILKESGVSHVRAMFNTLFPETYNATGADPVCPSDGAPCDFSRIDELIDGLKDCGVEIEPNLALYCPPWLSTKRESPYFKGLWITHRAPPTDTAKLAAIYAALVKHVNIDRKGGVKLWNIGNEPDDWTRYWVRGTFAEFVDLAKKTADAVRAVDPSVKLSICSLADINAKIWPENKLLWRDELLDALKGDIDDFSLHIYNEWKPGEQIRTMRDTFRKHGCPDMPLNINEYNLTPGDYDNADVFSINSAFYVCSMLKGMAEQGVDRAVFFMLTGSLGMLEEGSDGRTLIPRHSYHAFRMHSVLGRFKNAQVLPAAVSDPRMNVLACRHEDGKGFSVLAAVPQFPFHDQNRLKLNLTGAAGSYTVRQYALNDNANEIAYAAPVQWESGQPFRMIFPGRSVQLMVFRPVGEVDNVPAETRRTAEEPRNASAVKKIQIDAARWSINNPFGTKASIRGSKDNAVTVIFPKTAEKIPYFSVAHTFDPAVNISKIRSVSFKASSDRPMPLMFSMYSAGNGKLSAAADTAIRLKPEEFTEFTFSLADAKREGGFDPARIMTFAIGFFSWATDTTQGDVTVTIKDVVFNE